ncbi:MAG: XdhC family protein [Candidatus Acetothermia bacterium]|nr:XdhC family protein [Candidatus Acetothermia bacterium]
MEAAFFTRVAECLARGEPAVWVEVVAVEGPAPREPGARMLVFEGGRIEGTIGGGALEQRAREDAVALLSSGERTSLRTYELLDLGMLCGGRTTVFYEVLASRPRLVIFGAGHVGALLGRLAGEVTPFAVEVYDDRAERAGELAPGVVVHHLPGYALVPVPSGQTYAVICTDSHATDLHVATQVLAAEPAPAYVGMLGSRPKAAEVRKRLGEAGIPKERVELLRCPVGLPIGGKYPGAVAVSILAELLAFHHGRLVETRECLKEGGS